MRSDKRYRPYNAPVDAQSANKSVRSNLTYQRYTDWDSSSDSRMMASDERDERSSNSYERHATYVNEVRDGGAAMYHVDPRYHFHHHHLRSENANASLRGRTGPQNQLFSQTSTNAVEPGKLSGDDDTSVHTSITNSRSVTSPERKRRNSRYEPASKMSHSDSTVASRDDTACVVSDACIIESNRGGHASVKTAQVGKQPSQWSDDRKFPDVNSISEESHLRGQSNCYSSIGTSTVASAKPPLGPRASRVHNSTPRINNTTSCVSTVAKSDGKLIQSNTSVSSFTRDDDTHTIENSIPTALEFVAKSVMSVNSKHNQSNSDRSEMKYWMDLSVCAAISVIQAKGSEAIAEKAATTVVEAGAKMNLREKKRDMQQVLRFLATKTSVAVLEAGGNQRVATAVAHAIMTYEYFPNDFESIAESEVDRSVMLSKIDRSISQNMQKSKKISRISDLTGDQKDKLAEKVKCSGMKLSASSTIRSEGPASVKRNENATISRHPAAVPAASVSKKMSHENDQPKQNAKKDSSSTNRLVASTQKADVSKSSDITISQSNLSFEKSSQHAESRSQALSAKEKAIEEAARLNAQREQEINEKMAALDAATNALLAKANDVQHYIDQQVAQKQHVDASYYGAGTSKEFLHAFSCDDPGFHHNFNGRSFQVDNKYRHHSHNGRDKEKSVFEKLTNGLAQMLDLTCATPTTGTQASSGIFTTQFPSHAPEHRLPNLNCNGGMIDSNYSEPYAYSEKNDDVNDMISALTDDVPMHKKWQKNSRLTLVTDHLTLDDYNRTHEPMHPMDTRRIASTDNRTPPLIDYMPTEQSGPNQVESFANESPPRTNHSGTMNNRTPPPPLRPPPNQSMHRAFDSAMNQLSSQLNLGPNVEQEEITMADLAQRHNRSSIGKLKSAFTRKKTPKSVTFGAPNDAPVTPRMFFGRRKLDSSDC
jgi:hypothetical protein